MSEAGEGHKRSKSSAFSKLKREKTREASNDSGNESANSLTKVPSQTSAPLAHSASRGHAARPSTGAAGLMRSVSNIQNGRNMPPPAAPEKPVSIEQSVRKFRIFEALRSGDTAAISKAIRDTESSRASTSSTAGMLEDTTILHLAIQCAELPVVEYVLSEGAASIDINARDKDGNTALHLVALQNRAPLVRVLLDTPGINDSVLNYQGRTPLDLARNPEIFQQLQLARSVFADKKIKEIQGLIKQGDYTKLGEILDEPRVKTVLDINGGEFASEITTVQSGGTLLHEAARQKNTALIQTLLLHGADPFRRDRRGKLPQDVTKDDNTRAMLKRSPAAVAAQRGIQEKAVLGNAQQVQGVLAADSVAGKEAREMKGYLKKWTNYRKGYQLRWFVLEDGVMSYYKHQDDSGSACRGAINMRIAKLNMDPTEKTKFDIIGKSSVKYNLKANHEVEAKRWFWALNNAIQWTKDQAKEEELQKNKSAEALRQAKTEQSLAESVVGGSTTELNPEGQDTRRSSFQATHLAPQPIPKVGSHKVAFASGSVADDEEGTAFGSYEPSFVGGDLNRMSSNVPRGQEMDDEDDFDDASDKIAPASKDAFELTVQSAKLQLDMMAQVNTALQNEQTRNPKLSISDSGALQALQTYDNSIKSLKDLVSSLLKISRDRDAHWQQRLDRESDMRHMWEDSMAQVAREQEILEQKIDHSEEKRKLTKRALREAIEGSAVLSRPASAADSPEPVFTDAFDDSNKAPLDSVALRRKSTAKSSLRRKSILQDVTGISDSDSADEEEFFDAVDAGEVNAIPMAAQPLSSPLPPAVEKSLPQLDGGIEREIVSEKLAEETSQKAELVAVKGIDISSSYKGYEDGIRKRLKMDADERPKISLWGILKSMIGKDMTKMTLPVSFNEPTSLLQRSCEDMEYSDILDQAVARTDPVERMVFIAGWACSLYAASIGRVAKPFNPLLGETYEYVRPDKSYRYFTEQISHHPPIGAVWAESPNWTYWGEADIRSKFYGKSFDIAHMGTWFLKLQLPGGKEELYTWRKCTSTVVGIITGSPTVDNYGPCEIKNWTSGETCLIDFKPRGWKASSAYQLTGRVNDASGKPRYSIGGRWNHKIYARLTPGYEALVEEPKTGPGHHRGSVSDPNQVFIVWEANPRPSGIPFNITPFSITLNNIDDNIRRYLPPTDTRLRPDQRAMEDGEYDFAASEKNRVEERQRARRRQREAAGEHYVSPWFGQNKQKCATSGIPFWQFNGRYWMEREKGPTGEAWKGVEGVEDIFGLKLLPDLVGKEW